MKLSVFTYTAAGKNKQNEDRIYSNIINEHAALFIIADGMGGYEHGAISAELVVKGIASSVLENISTTGYNEYVLTRAMEQANYIVKRESYSLHAKLGCAVTVCLIIDNYMYFSWLGNVRIYRIRDKCITQQTQDHVLLGYPTVLTRCINGKSFEKPIPLSDCQIKRNDRYVMCTDGFYNFLNEQSLTASNAQELVSNIESVDDVSVIEFTIQ